MLVNEWPRRARNLLIVEKQMLHSWYLIRRMVIMYTAHVTIDCYPKGFTKVLTDGSGSISHVLSKRKIRRVETMKNVSVKR